MFKYKFQYQLVYLYVCVWKMHISVLDKHLKNGLQLVKANRILVMQEISRSGVLKSTSMPV